VVFSAISTHCSVTLTVAVLLGGLGSGVSAMVAAFSVMSVPDGAVTLTVRCTVHVVFGAILPFSWADDLSYSLVCRSRASAQSRRGGRSFPPACSTLREQRCQGPQVSYRQRKPKRLMLKSPGQGYVRVPQLDSEMWVHWQKRKARRQTPTLRASSAILLARFLLTQSRAMAKMPIAATECRLLCSPACGSNAKHHLRAAVQLDILFGAEQDAGSVRHPRILLPR